MRRRAEECFIIHFFASSSSLSLPVFLQHSFAYTHILRFKFSSNMLYSLVFLSLFLSVSYIFIYFHSFSFHSVSTKKKRTRNEKKKERNEFRSLSLLLHFIIWNHGFISFSMFSLCNVHFSVETENTGANG